MNNCW